MLTLSPAVRIYLATGATDLRRSIDGLSALVRERLMLDPLSGHLFLFRNRRGDRLKILAWDRSGFWVLYKRLEQTALPGIKTLLVCRPSSGPGARSVACGRHAFELAEALMAHVMKSKASEGQQTATHMFIAGPGAFAFFLGQRQPGLGRVVLYEFDFEGTRSGSYEPSLSLPIA